MNILLARASNIQEILDINELLGDKDGSMHPKNFILESFKGNRLYICEDNGSVVGYLLYQLLWGNTILLSLINVHPNFQRQGIGTQLVHYFEQDLKLKGHSSYISSTEYINLHSQGFHEKNNLQKIGSLDMEHGNEIFYIKNV